MTPLLIGFGAVGIRAMKHQLSAASAATAAVAVGDDAALASLGTLKSRHPIHRAWLKLPADLGQTKGWRPIFEHNVLGLYQTLRPLLSAPRLIGLYAELGALESGGTAALFAREIAEMRLGHQVIANLFKPVTGNGAAVTYLADTQLFTLSHYALSLQIVAEDHLTRQGEAGGFSFADATAVMMWNEHLERAGLLVEAAANQRRTEIGLVAINGSRVRREAKAMAG
jgi:hypothetical protein